MYAERRQVLRQKQQERIQALRIAARGTKAKYYAEKRRDDAEKRRGAMRIIQKNNLPDLLHDVNRSVRAADRKTDCVKRKERRAVLFSVKQTGKGAKAHKTPYKPPGGKC